MNANMVFHPTKEWIGSSVNVAKKFIVLNATIKLILYLIVYNAVLSIVLVVKKNICWTCNQSVCISCWNDHIVEHNKGFIRDVVKYT